MTKLVIVESPTKVKKIQAFLGKGWDVDSCVGHIRDLPRNKKDAPKAIQDKPWADFGVDVENGFEPYYVTIRGKNQVITRLKKKLQTAEALYLATDEDREGESISWHLVQALKPKVPVYRMVFNEITKKAILQAVENPRQVDEQLVQAQETRRILDRLYGYTLSPLLWRRIGGKNLSAGRVQSPAVRLIVERERERMAFKAGHYYDLLLQVGDQPYPARLTSYQGSSVATGSDFDPDTGRIRAGRDVLVLDQDRVRKLAFAVTGQSLQVAKTQATPRSASPPPPFITSTLQQEGNNRLNLSSKQTMQIAQSLYQEGFITYMRTDSTHLSDEAIAATREAITHEYGAPYTSQMPRRYGKKDDHAQEAHEAIRPSGEQFKHPKQTGLTGKDLALYDLIYRRTLASQMPDEKSLSQRIELVWEGQEGPATFVATGKQVTEPGYRKAWPVSRPEPGLPTVREGEGQFVTEAEPQSHETKPPARYTEASLVRKLEEAGIGRPSTYASIIDAITRTYVRLEGKALVPSLTAMAVVQLMERDFPELVQYDFTASMENELDQIAEGHQKSTPFLTKFYHGEAGLQSQVQGRMEDRDTDMRTLDLPLPEGIQIRLGRYGPYIEFQESETAEKVQVSVPEDVSPAELTVAYVKELVETKRRADEPFCQYRDGTDIFLKTGRFGPYLTMELDGKNINRSLPRGVTPETVTAEDALVLMDLPRHLGPYPEGGEVYVDLGRFGPYVKVEGGAKRNASLSSFQQLKDVDLEEAVALLQAKKAPGPRGPTVLKELGAHPRGGEVQLLAGRYGPYVKHGKTNASIPKDMDPSAVTMEVAVQLLDAREERNSS